MSQFAKSEERRPDESLLQFAHRRAASLGISVVQSSTSDTATYAEDLIPEVSTDRAPAAAEDVSTILERVDIVDAYARWCGKMIPNVGQRRESIMVSCPQPGHPDANPSAWMSLDKGDGGVGHCPQCGGFDKYDIAAWHFGLDTRAEFPELRLRMAEALGYTAPPTAPPSAAPPPGTASSNLDRLRNAAMSTDELADIPAPSPLIEGLLYLDSLAMMWGASGVGKSFVAIDLALHVSSNRDDWHGHSVTHAQALYVAAEGASGVRLRTDAWRQHWSATDDMRWIPEPVNIFEPEWAEALGQYGAEIGAKLIVIDTLARSTVGATENATEDATLIIEHCDQIRRATGACVLLVHHAGKDPSKGARGNSALKAGLDTELEASGSTRDGIKLSNTKQKNAAEADLVGLAFESVGESGVIVGAPVPRSATGRPEDETLHVLVTCGTVTGMTSAEWAAAVNCSERTFYRHVEKLRGSGDVALTKAGNVERYQVVRN